MADQIAHQRLRRTCEPGQAYKFCQIRPKAARVRTGRICQEMVAPEIAGLARISGARPQIMTEMLSDPTPKKLAHMKSRPPLKIGWQDAHLCSLAAVESA